MDLLLFGIQGSGKGTQGKALAQKYGLKIFEMGGELRRMIQSGTPLGNEIKSIVEGGNLVSTSIIIKIVEQFLNELAAGKPVLFDGIPRTMDQAEQLESLLKKHQRSWQAIVISLSREEAMERLIKRRVCSECKMVHPGFYSKKICEACGGSLITRKDDNAKSIEKRLENYYKETLPVIDSYKKRGCLIEVEGHDSISKVTERVIEKTESLFEKN